MKSPPIQYSDNDARRKTEEFIEKQGKPVPSREPATPAE